MSVRAKKHLGQHFLRDENIARKIAESLKRTVPYSKVLEVGPGMGMLTKYLLAKADFETWVVEIDRESVTYLEQNYPELNGRIISKDFLDYNLAEQFKEPIGIIGNFPYNISSQILFKAVENRDLVLEVVGMFQREVALRLAAKEGSKTYGISSVLIQAWYKIEYLLQLANMFFVRHQK